MFGAASRAASRARDRRVLGRRPGSCRGGKGKGKGIIEGSAGTVRAQEDAAVVKGSLGQQRVRGKKKEGRGARGEARGERREARGERGGFGRGKADRRTATAVCHTGGDACAHVSREGLGNCKSSSWRGGWRLPG